MAWEWSHAPEAYQAAADNVHRLSKKTLLTILREWAYDDREKADKTPHFRLPFNGRKLPQDLLADKVVERMEELRTCDNGGHAAWCCPDGCHTVPFDPPKENDNDPK